MARRRRSDRPQPRRNDDPKISIQVRGEVQKAQLAHRKTEEEKERYKEAGPPIVEELVRKVLEKARCFRTNLVNHTIRFKQDDGFEARQIVNPSADEILTRSRDAMMESNRSLFRALSAVHGNDKSKLSLKEACRKIRHANARSPQDMHRLRHPLHVMDIFPHYVLDEIDSAIEILGALVHSATPVMDTSTSHPISQPGSKFKRRTTAIPLTGMEATEEINNLFRNDPPWPWKKARRWLKEKDVTIYDRSSWLEEFCEAPPKLPGKVVFVNALDLFMAFRKEHELDERAFKVMDNVEKAKSTHKRK